VVRMVLDAEVPVDDLGHPGRGPEGGTVPVGEGALAQELEELSPLACGQLRRPARRGAHEEPARPATPHGVAPAHHRTRGTAQPARDGIQREPLSAECQGLPASSFEDRGGAFGSHGGCPPGRTTGTASIIALFTQESIARPDSCPSLWGHRSIHCILRLRGNSVDGEPRAYAVHMGPGRSVYRPLSGGSWSCSYRYTRDLIQ
jgi:hypothetical protein